jgi:hypothetical protein
LQQAGFEEYLCAVTDASSCREVEVLQSLWSGYGKIVRYALQDGSTDTVIVKHIALGKAGSHPRGWDTDTSHQRKKKSYQVETNWYNYFASHTTSFCKVPKFLGSFNQDDEQWIVLEDLDKHYPVRKEYCTFDEAKVCLQWLAHFHARFMQQEPKGLWPIGTYWHLDTRPDELEQMEDSPLKRKAHEIDTILNQCTFKTIVHGDAKVANFCFSEDGKKVAAVDFQYVGGGCGMKDVAYFLGSCLTSEECALYEEELLNTYFKTLREALQDKDIDVNALEQEWRKLYPYACADFVRFLLGWMPTHRKVNNYYLSKVEKVLRELS